MQWAVATGVAVVTASLFWPTVGFGWLRYWDDGAHLIWNEAYKGLSLSHLWWMLHPFLGQWMPLTWLSWAIDYTLWGLEPAAFHRENVLLHALNAGLLYLIARRLLRSTPGALFAALLWAVHPMRVESVAWINERRDVLSGLFFLLSVLLYLRYVQTKASKLASYLSIFCFALAVLSKSLAVSLPLVLFLLDYYPLRRRAFLEKIPYLVIAGGGTVMAFAAIGQMDVLAPLGWISLEDRALIVAYSLWFYPLATLWPTNLSPMYELTFRPAFWSWQYLVPLAGVIGTSWFAWRTRHTWPPWTVVWVAYAVTVLPVSGLFQNGYQLVALRYSYLATLPFALLVGGMGAAWWERTRPSWRPVLAMTSGAGLSLLAVLTTAYLPVYRSDIPLWTRALSLDPACVVCADYVVHVGDLGHARTVLADVVARRPDLQEQRWQLGMVAFMRARGPEGEAHFQEYIRQAGARDPGYIPRIESDRQKHLALARHVLTRPQQTGGKVFDGELRGFQAVR